MASWTKSQSVNSTFATVSSPVHGGSVAAALTSTSTTNKSIYQNIGVTGNINYTLSGWAYKVDANTNLLRLRIAWYVAADCSGSQLATVDSTGTVTTSVSWQSLTTGSVIAPATATCAQVRAMLDPASSTSATSYFDDLSFVSDSPTNTPTNTLIPPTNTPTPTSTSTIRSRLMKNTVSHYKNAVLAVIACLVFAFMAAGCSDDEEQQVNMGEAQNIQHKAEGHDPFDHSHDVPVTDIQKHKFEHDFAAQCVERELKNSTDKDADKARWEKPCMCIATFMMKDLTADEAEKFIEEHKNTQSLVIKYENAAFHCLQSKQQPKSPQIFGRQQ